MLFYCNFNIDKSVRETLSTCNKLVLITKLIDLPKTNISLLYQVVIVKYISLLFYNSSFFTIQHANTVFRSE